jgi:hypothetical protein
MRKAGICILETSFCVDMQFLIRYTTVITRR